MKSRYGRLGTAAAVIAAVACLIGCAPHENAPDESKRTQTVDAIMAALHDKDPKHLVDLAGPAPASPEDAASLVSQWGGVSDTGYTVSYAQGMGPDHVTVRVQAADGSGHPATVSFPMSWHDGRWMLTIGHASGVSGPSAPADPTP